MTFRLLLSYILTQYILNNLNYTEFGIDLNCNIDIRDIVHPYQDVLQDEYLQNSLKSFTHMMRTYMQFGYDTQINIIAATLHMGNVMCI